jgi:hypothetical protein
VDVRCGGNKGRCRGLIAVLFWPEDPAEGPPKLKTSSISNYSLTRDLAGRVPLFCPLHTANVDYRLVELRPLLAGALATALAEKRTVTIDLSPNG